MARYIKLLGSVKPHVVHHLGMVVILENKIS